MTHKCPADGCEKVVPDELLLCPADWRRVPAPFRRAVHAAFRDGAGRGTPKLRAAQDAAIRAVNGSEHPPAGAASLGESAGSLS